MPVKKRIKISDIIIRVPLWAYAAIVVLPLVWVFSTSLKSNLAFAQAPWTLFREFQFENYANAWIKASFSMFAFNSAYITVLAVLISTILTCYTAYALVRLKFFGSETILMFFIMGLYIPIVLVLPSQFLLMNNMNLLDNHLALILIYVAFSLPFSILIMTGFMQNIPKEMEEAAHIDGCSYHRAFWSIIMPMSKNGILTIIIFNFLWIWNDYIIALTMIMSEAKMTLPVGVIAMQQSFRLRADWTTLFAALIIVMVPTIIIYIIFQKSLQKGLTLGAVKE